MNFLWGRSSITGSSDSQLQKAVESIDRLCERLRTSSLMEDKRAAIIGIKTYTQNYPLQVGTMGMNVFIGCLKDYYYETELVMNILEILIYLCKKIPEHSTALGSKVGEYIENISEQFSEILLKDSQNVSILFDILSKSEENRKEAASETANFYPKYYTMKLLNVLADNKAKLLKDSVLKNSNNIYKLIDLLNEEKEVIRNEGIGLLIKLSENSHEIQKIIAFENAFERLIDIIEGEGGLEESNFVTLDCLKLTFNLLNFNHSNQKYFRETNCIVRMISLLNRYINVMITMFKEKTPAYTMKEDDAKNQIFNCMKYENLLLLLKIFRLLIIPNHPNTSINQKIYSNYRLIDACLYLACLSMNLVHLNQSAFAIDVPVATEVINMDKLLMEGLYLLGDILNQNPENQGIFVNRKYIQYGKSTQGYLIEEAAQEFPIPSLLAITCIALDKIQNIEVRLAALYTFECFITDNFEGQLAIASTWIETPNTQIQQRSVGSLIMSSLIDSNTTKKEDVMVGWFAAAFMSLILNNNEDCKTLALKYMVAENDVEYDTAVNHQNKALLLYHMIKMLIKASSALEEPSRMNIDNRFIEGIIGLIIVWCWSSPETIRLYLSESSFIHYLLESMKETNLPNECQCLCIFLYGTLIYFNPYQRESEFNAVADDVFHKSQLVKLAQMSIGLDLLVSKLLSIKEYFAWNASSTEVMKRWKSNDAASWIWFDPLLSGLLKDNLDNIVRCFTGKVGKPSSEESLKSIDARTMLQLTKEKSKLEANVSTLELEVLSLNAQLQERKLHYEGEIEALRRELLESRNLYNELKVENDDLFACLGEMDAELLEYKERLKIESSPFISGVKLDDENVQIASSNSTPFKENYNIMETYQSYSLSTGLPENELAQSTDTNELQEISLQELPRSSRSLSPSGPFHMKIPPFMRNMFGGDQKPLEENLSNPAASVNDSAKKGVLYV